MTVRLNPYIGFRGNAREAGEFYHSVFGGELTINTFEESGMGDAYPGEGHKVMHGQLESKNGLVLMVADVPCGMEQESGSSISVSLSGDDEGQLRGYWEKLSAGGTVTEPFVKAPWGDVFGMCTDRFGVNWMVNATASAS